MADAAMTSARSAARLSLEVTPGASLLISWRTSRLAVIAASLRRMGGGDISIDAEEGGPPAELGTSRNEAGAVSRCAVGISRTDAGAASRNGCAPSRKDVAGTSRTDGGASRSETGALWIARAPADRGAASRLELRLDGGVGSHGELAVIGSRIG